MRPVFRFFLRPVLAVAGIVGLMVDSAHATDPPRLPVPVNRWNVDYGTLRCSLARRLGGEQSPVLILSSYLGRDEPEFILMRAGDQALPDLPDQMDVVLSPSNERETVHVERRTGYAYGVALSGLREGFFDRFAAARNVRFEADGRVIVDLPIPFADRAVAFLRSCNDDLLRSWGIDPALQAAWRRPPTAVSGTIDDDDYPAAAMRAGQSGAVVVRYVVGTGGRVSDCVVLVSSRSPELDSTTCRLFTQRLRFEPALDAEGRAVSALLVRTVVWRLP
jgi:TonB family protein